MQQKFNQDVPNLIVSSINNNEDKIKLETEIHNMIEILTELKMKQGSRNPVPKLMVGIEIILLAVGITALYFGITGFSSSRAEELNIEDQKTNLFYTLLVNWMEKNMGNGTCNSVYNGINNNDVCPPSASIILNFCKELLNEYCTKIDKLNLDLQHLPVSFAYFGIVAIGIFCVLISASLFTTQFGPRLCKTTNYLDHLSQRNLNNLHKLAQCMPLEIDKPIEHIIQQLKNELIQPKRSTRSLIFFTEAPTQSKDETSHLLRMI